MPEAKKTKRGRPTVAAALRAIIADADPGERDFDRISVRLLETGEVTYRLHHAREDSYEGSVVSVV